MSVTLGKFKKTDLGLFRCRICGLSGRLDDLIKNPDKDWDEIKKRQAEARELALKEVEAQRLVTIDWLNKHKIAESLHSKIWGYPEIISSLEKDGITKPLIIKWKIGYNPNFVYYVDEVRHKGGAISFPIKNKEIVVNIRMRIVEEIDGNKYRPIRRGLDMAFLYAGFPWDDRIFIVEGEKKAIVLNGYGIPAIGLFGVEVWNNRWGSWLRKNFKYRYLMFDNERENPNVQRAANRICHSADAIQLKVPGKPDDFMNEVRNVVKFYESIRRVE